MVGPRGNAAPERLVALLAEQPGISDAEMAARLGVTASTLAHTKQLLRHSGDLPPARLDTGSDRPIEINLGKALSARLRAEAKRRGRLPSELARALLAGALEIPDAVLDGE